MTQCTDNGVVLGYEDLNDHDEVSRDPLLATAVGKATTLGGVRISHHVLSLGGWRVPVTEFRPRGPGSPMLVLPENGRAAVADVVQTALADGRHVFVADLFAFGEQVIAGGAYHYLFMECVAAGGERPLGICTAQLLAVAAWIRSRAGKPTLDVSTQGLSTGLTALCAAALHPGGLGTLNINVPDTLRRLIDWQVDYVQNPVAFCFGLLEQFDIEDLVCLSSPVRIEIEARGPMR